MDVALLRATSRPPSANASLTVVGEAADTAVWSARTTASVSWPAGQVSGCRSSRPEVFEFGFEASDPSEVLCDSFQQCDAFPFDLGHPLRDAHALMPRKQTRSQWLSVIGQVVRKASRSDRLVTP